MQLKSLRKGDAPFDDGKAYDKVTELPPEPDRKGVSPDQLGDFHCRWPLGDPLTPQFRYCGDRKIPGSSYCPHHHQVAYPYGGKLRRRPRTVIERPQLRLVHPDEFEPA